MNHLRRLLPYIPSIGPRALQRKLVDLVPHQGVQQLKAFSDGMQEKSVGLYRSKLDALARGDEAVTRQLGEGKDILTIMSE